MAKTIETVIDRYLEIKSTYWSPSTLKSETARLNGLKKILFKVQDFNPAQIYRILKDQGKKPYTITTTMIRLADLERFALEQGMLPVGVKLQCDDFVRRALRGYSQAAYVRKAPKVSYEEAQKRIAQISCEKTRAFAQTLLETGLRVSEGAKIEENTETKKATVKGKGGRTRFVFNLKNGAPEGVNYTKLYRALRDAGLKPHDLRKIAANRFAKVLRVHELKEVMGWTSLETAQSYLQVNQVEELDNRLKALGG